MDATAVSPIVTEGLLVRLEAKPDTTAWFAIGHVDVMAAKLPHLGEGE